MITDNGNDFYFLTLQLEGIMPLKLQKRIKANIFDLRIVPNEAMVWQLKHAVSGEVFLPDMAITNGANAWSEACECLRDLHSYVLENTK
ncbi:hypothetical protein [Geminocystis sp. NIES-3709]|uniref:hypothetical protein n=1 Tax=Geminocystis sp. NIES-3709 TaxID=1617448 RepID=UPI0005FC4DD0|nr:hypothetical protein [Geminocystis sp. NIES-3709]BAQ67096.1 hypothetical protein GM3709_3861 [Geminocystis sp. NIES-3709]